MSEYAVLGLSEEKAKELEHDPQFKGVSCRLWWLIRDGQTSWP